MLAVKCLLVLDSFYVTMKDTVVSFDAIVYSKQKTGTKKCAYWGHFDQKFKNAISQKGLNESFQFFHILQSTQDFDKEPLSV